MSNRFRNTVVFVFLMLALVLAGCTGSSKETQAPSAENKDLAYTQAAQTIVVDLTQNAPAPATEVAMPAPASPTAPVEVLPPTSTPEPTKTPIPTDTPVPTETPLPSNTPTITATWTATKPPEPQFKLVYSDSFSGGFWPKCEPNSQAILHYALGGYVVQNLVEQDMVYAVRRQLDLEFSDLRIEVRASRVQENIGGCDTRQGLNQYGSIDGYYGVTCRFADGRNYYALVVGSDGWYGIGKKVMNVLTWMASGKDTSLVHTGNASNLIRADCIGNKLTLWANGEKVAEVEDDTFSAGSFGFVVGTRDDAGYEALFDDLKVYVPIE
jgi:hypothetical protein